MEVGIEFHVAGEL